MWKQNENKNQTEESSGSIRSVNGFGAHINHL